MNGVVDGRLDLSVALSNLPLALANTFKPELGLGGTINGTARITGTKEAPDVAFDMAARGVTAAELKSRALQLSMRMPRVLRPVIGSMSMRM